MSVSPNAQRAYSFLRERGLTHAQASAVVGNLMQESGQGLRTGAVGDGGNSFGIAQWNGPRRMALRRFAEARGAEPSSLDTQLEFLWHELQGAERRAFDALTRTDDLREATLAFSNLYERPGDPRNETRVRYAAAVAGLPDAPPDTQPDTPEAPERRAEAPERRAEAPDIRALIDTRRRELQDDPDGIRALIDTRRGDHTSMGDLIARGTFGAMGLEGVAGLRDVRAAGDSVARGLTFGASDELTAFFNEPGEIGAHGANIMAGANLPTPGYDATLRRQRERERDFSERHPGRDIAGEIAGGVAGAVALAPAVGAAGPAVATTRTGRVAQAAGAGAAEGAAQGFGQGEGGFVGRAVEGGAGAVVGALTGIVGREVAVAAARAFNALLRSGQRVTANGTFTQAARDALRQAGIDPDAVPDEVARLFERRAARETITPDTARRAAADEFGIPLDRGQALGREGFREQAFLDAAAKNTYGEGAGRVVRDLRDRQHTAYRGALDGMVPGTEDAISAGEGVSRGLTKARERGRQFVRAQYDNLAPGDAVIDVSFFDDLQRRIDRGLEGVSLSPGSEARGAKARIDQLVRRVRETEGAVGVDFLAVEELRQTLGNIERGMRREGSREAFQLSAIRKELDQWIDDALGNALISGDMRALNEVRAARRAHRVFADKFLNGTDDVTRGLSVLSDPKARPEGPEPREVVNYLFGSSQVGAAPHSVRMARRIRRILGEESPEWGQLRRGAWHRVYNGTRAANAEGAPAELGQQAIASRILDFTQGEGRGLAQVLFTEAERQKMTRLANVLRMMVPAKGATNPSGTGGAVSRALQDVADLFTQGAATAATGSAAAGFGARFLSGMFREGRAAGAARSMVEGRGFAPGQARPGSTAGALAGGAVGAISTDRYLER